MESKNKWWARIQGAWQVLTGKAYASYYVNMPRSIFWCGNEGMFEFSAENDPTKWEPINEISR